MGIPTRDIIFKGSVDRVTDIIARPSLDTFYEVDFAFGGKDLSSPWLSSLSSIGKKRTQGTDFQTKMSLLCTQAELPGTSFIESSVTGNHQGITELFPNLRNFPPLNLSFYVDADHVILEVLETWMSYINPVLNKGASNAYAVFNYPEDYKERIYVTKFERDTFIKESRAASYQSKMSSYEFINVWPINLTSMRVAYGDSNVLRCNIQLAYDRFQTSFNYPDVQRRAISTSDGIINSNDIREKMIPDLSNTTPKELMTGGINEDSARNNVNAGVNNFRNNINAGIDAFPYK